MNRPTHLPWASPLLATALALGVLTAPTAAAAQGVPCGTDSDHPCNYFIGDVAIQPVPAVLNLQAQISQAKFPVGDASFERITVKVRSQDNQELCSESFQDVIVRDSVLNLEVGRLMTCPLAEIIAANNDLQFQICIGNDDANCLKPIGIGTVPYATKASFAATSQNANRANEAAVSHYAHRLTADRSLFVEKEIGTGFFDFQTPENPASGPLPAVDLDFTGDGVPESDQAGFLPYAEDGFIQWVQIAPSPNGDADRRLHICGRSLNPDTLQTLDQLVVHAVVSRFTNNVDVDGNLNVDENANVVGSATVLSGLFVQNVNATGAPNDFGSVVEQGLQVGNGLESQGPFTVNGTADIVGATTVDGSVAFTANGGSESITMETSNDVAAPEFELTDASLIVRRDFTVDTTGGGVPGEFNVVTGGAALSVPLEASAIRSPGPWRVGAPEGGEGGRLLTVNGAGSAPAAPSALINGGLVVNGGSVQSGLSSMGDVDVNGQLEVQTGTLETQSTASTVFRGPVTFEQQPMFLAGIGVADPVDATPGPGSISSQSQFNVEAFPPPVPGYAVDFEQIGFFDNFEELYMQRFLTVDGLYSNFGGEFAGRVYADDVRIWTNGSQTSVGLETGDLVIGSQTATMGIDANEILVRDQNGPTTLKLQREGGSLTIGELNPTSVNISGDVEMNGTVDINGTLEVTSYVETNGPRVPLGQRSLQLHDDGGDTNVDQGHYGGYANLFEPFALDRSRFNGYLRGNQVVQVRVCLAYRSRNQSTNFTVYGGKYGTSEYTPQFSAPANSGGNYEAERVHCGPWWSTQLDKCDSATGCGFFIAKSLDVHLNDAWLEFSTQ
jgi:hypothetical protein